MNNTANESLVNTEEQIQADFNGPYSARVHLIGRSTMLIALVLSRV